MKRVSDLTVSPYDFWLCFLLYASSNILLRVCSSHISLEFSLASLSRTDFFKYGYGQILDYLEKAATSSQD